MKDCNGYKSGELSQCCEQTHEKFSFPGRFTLGGSTSIGKDLKKSSLSVY